VIAEPQKLIFLGIYWVSDNLMAIGAFGSTLQTNIPSFAQEINKVSSFDQIRLLTFV